MDTGWIITALLALLSAGFYIWWKLKLRGERLNAPPPEHSNAHRAETWDRTERIQKGGLGDGGSEWGA